MKRILVSKCQDIIQCNDEPFKAKNLTTEKIFKDLFEYHQIHFRNSGGVRDNNKIVSAIKPLTLTERGLHGMLAEE